MNIVKPVPGKGRPRKFQIPDHFSCLGHKVKVLVVSGEDLLTLSEGEDHLSGMYDHDAKTIYLSEAITGSSLEQTFLHELMHCILLHTGYEELSDDEILVDMLGELFYQFIVTKKGYKNFEPHAVKEPSSD